MYVGCQSRVHVSYLHLLAINIQGTNSKVHSDGVLLLLDEYARFEALDHTGFPHIRVPNQDDFEKKVERVLSLRPCRLHGGRRNVCTQQTQHPEVETLAPGPRCLDATELVPSK